MDLIEPTIDYLRQGGWVMAPLVLVSLAMWTLIVDRLREYARLSRGGLAERLQQAFRAERSGIAEIDRLVLQGCAMRLKRRLDRQPRRGRRWLAAVAPLLGLLGTVLGMIETFEVISIFGTGNSRAMAGGISVALITTQTGLLVAIPGLLMSNRLSRKATQLKTGLDEAAAALSRGLTGGRATPMTEGPVSCHRE